MEPNTLVHKTNHERKDKRPNHKTLPKQTQRGLDQMARRQSSQEKEKEDDDARRNESNKRRDRIRDSEDESSSSRSRSEECEYRTL